MSACHERCPEREHGSRAASGPACEQGPEAGPARATLFLVPGETLFHEGEVRDAAYEVEEGALCHYMHWEGGGHEVIEFAFPGDVVGLGHLATRISTAQAMVDTRLRRISVAELDRRLRSDATLAMRLAAAADREFDIVRRRTLAARPDDPVRRVASFLVALAHAEGREGRPADLIPGEVAGGWVADAVNLSIEALEEALATLERKGLVARTKPGLRLADPAGLEKLADAA